MDHNGECLVCDCWLRDCGWHRLWTGDFSQDSFLELLETFKDHLTEEEKQQLNGKYMS